MAEYHYKYDPPRREHVPGPGPTRTPGPDRAPSRRSGGSGLFELLFDAVFALLAAIPTAIGFAVRQLTRLFSDSSAGSTGAGDQSTGTPHSNLHQVQRPAPGQPKKDKDDQRAVKPNEGRGLIVLGAILTAVFGVGLSAVLTDGSGLAVVIAEIALMGGGLLTLWAGIRKRKKARLYLKYLGLIGRRESVSLTTLAQAAGRSRKKVCKELQDMLDKGVLPAGYLDLANDKLVLSAQGIDDAPAPEPEPVKTEADDNAVLRQIKEVNDSIPDPVMTAKIDRIGEITGKILDYQRKNPGKAGQLRSFLNYYLPTTLKILQAYAQLDGQGVEGANISAAKARIEGMMDKVVEGFEKQLDRLFQDDALDITSDVAVLEQMLDKDGLGSQGMTMEL